MTINEIPLSTDNQTFRITLGNNTFTLRIIWRDVARWIMDVMGSAGQPVLLGVPLVTDVNLLEQYPELGINGALVVRAGENAGEYPTKINLGAGARLYFIQE